MQSTMESIGKVVVAGEESKHLSVKISIASGPVRRFLVGDPAIQLIAVLAGETLQRMAEGEHLARRGEVLVDVDTASCFLDLAVWGESRQVENGAEFKVMVRLQEDIDPVTWPALPSQSIQVQDVRPWLLPQIYHRLEENLGDFLTELRPACPLFVSFSGIDFDNDSQAGEKLNHLIRRVQNELARFDGTLLEVIIGDKGSYFYAVIGAPTAHEDDAQRAVKAALVLRKLIASLDWQATTKIGVSLGLLRTGAYGGLTRRSYGVLGDDVNLAARLMTRARAGEILVTNQVYQAISSETKPRSSGFNFEPQPPIRVKGKSEPLPVFAIEGIQIERSIRLQEPAYALPMVGRDIDRKIVEDKIDLVLSGQGQIVGITAEAGMGKSRLIAEAIRSARRKGLVCYGGACQSDGTHIPYLVWGPIWQAIFEINQDSPVRRQIRSLEIIVEELVPTRLDALPLLGPFLGMTIPENDFTGALEPRSRRSALQALLVDSLKAVANEPGTLVTSDDEHDVAGASGASKSRALFLVLEDVHWIDQDSAALLEILARLIVDLPVLILLAYRPGKATDELERVTALPHFTRINLSALSPGEAEQAVQAKLAQLYPEWRGAMPGKLIQRVIEQAEGNPFYAELLLNYLHDRDIDIHKDEDVEKLEAPTTLRSLILSRIDQLASRQQLTLKVASIIGRLFRFDHLHGYYPDLGTVETLHTDLDVLAKLDLTPLETPEPELSYLFHHIVTQEVAYETLPASTRTHLHELYARFIEERAGKNISLYLDLLAYHYGLSENIEKKIGILHQAAEAAAARFSNEDAIRYYQGAISALEKRSPSRESDALDQAGMEEKLADILNLATRYDEARLIYLAALKNHPATCRVERAQITYKIANTWRDQHQHEESLKIYTEALKILGEDALTFGTIPGHPDSAKIDRKDLTAAWQCWIQIHLEMLSLYYWLAWISQSEEIFQKIKPVIEQYGTPAQRGSHFHALAAYYLSRGRYYVSVEAVTNYQAALEAYQQAGIHENVPAAHFQYGLVLLFSGQFDQAEQELLTALQLAEQRDDLTLNVRCLTYLTILYRQKGLVEKVVGYAERSLRSAAAAHMPEYVGAARANQAWIAWRSDDLLAASEHAQAALALWMQSPGTRAAATPYYWTAIWPLIGSSLARNVLPEAIQYSRSLLEPNQARMPDELKNILEQASASWDSGHVDTAVEILHTAIIIAEKYHYF